MEYKTLFQVDKFQIFNTEMKRDRLNIPGAPKIAHKEFSYFFRKEMTLSKLASAIKTVQTANIVILSVNILWIECVHSAPIYPPSFTYFFKKFLKHGTALLIEPEIFSSATSETVS